MAPTPYTVIQRGFDTSNRKLLANARMWLAFDIVCDRLGDTPTIVQGAYMSRIAGGGADASAGYHDEGGCLDLRVWDLGSKGLTVSQVIHVTRLVGWASWLRDAQHGGFDPHIHMVLMGDRDAAPGARDQMQQYRDGRDGLSSRGPDYHWRPNPLVTDFDYQAELRKSDMSAEDVQHINDHTDTAVKRAADRVVEAVRNQGQVAAKQRARALAAIEALPDQQLTKKDVRAAVEKALADDTGGTP